MPEAAAPTVAELIYERSRLRPRSTAIECGPKSLTYQQLCQRVDVLAGELDRFQVGPGDLVAILLPRSAELVVAELAVMRKGAAFVPLDPSDPPLRIRVVLQNVNPQVVITSAGCASLYGIGAPVIDPAVLGGEGPVTVAPPPVAADGDDLAYVMYTSGSTGRPKGVMIPYRGVRNHCLAIRRAFGLTEGDRVLQCVSPSVDVSLEEIFPTLVAGSTLVIYEVGAATAPLEFLREVGRLRISVLNIPTGFWQELVRAVDRAGHWPESIRLLVVGGERLNPHMYKTWRRQRAPGVRFINGYGPTEATVTATFFDDEWLTDDWEDGDEVPIGRPIDNMRAYVLDGTRKQVKCGEAGELHLSGPGVAVGYLNNEELTWERFFPSPWDPDETLCATGDIVSRDASGLIVFHARRDNQVKIRGFRVELGEIEATLEQHPVVAQAVVVPILEDDVGRTLRAFIVPRKRATPGVVQMNEWLRDCLPDHMALVALEYLDSLPVTDSGKIDREALANRPIETQPEPARQPADVNSLEEALAAIWSEVLRVPPIGLRSNFFDLGGHSLLAMRVLSEVEAKLHLTCSLHGFFHAATVEELARVLSPVSPAVRDGNGKSEGKAKLRHAELVTVKQGSNDLPMFCIGGAHIYTDLASALPSNRSVYAVFLQNLRAESVATPSIPELAERYTPVIESQHPKGPLCIVGYCFRGLLAYEVAQQLLRRGRTVQLLCLIGVSLPVGEREPMARWALSSPRSLLKRKILTVCDTMLWMKKQVASLYRALPSSLQQGFENVVYRLIAGKRRIAVLDDRLVELNEASRLAQHLACERYQDQIQPYESRTLLVSPRHRWSVLRAGLAGRVASRLSQFWSCGSDGGLGYLCIGRSMTVEIDASPDDTLHSHHVNEVSQALEAWLAPDSSEDDQRPASRAAHAVSN